MNKKNILVGQSGGPTAVINGSLYGVICEGARHSDEVGCVYGNLLDSVHAGVEDHLPLEGRGGVIKVKDDVLGPVNGLKSPANEMLPCLDQHLDGHIIRDMSSIDQRPEKLKFGL